MDVWLLRHADAEERSPSGRDEDRSLTRDGAERAAAVGRGLARLAPRITVVWSSPYRRALQTARAVAAALGAEVTELAALAPGGAAEDVVGELAAARHSAALLVGHEPLLGAAIGLLVHGDERRDVPMRKAALAHVAWDPGGDGTLEALLPPEVTERLGR